MDVLPIQHADPVADTALHTRAAWVDRSARGRTSIEGAQARAMLTGLVTNDVLALAPGQGQYAAAPTPKGKILADVRIFCVADGRLLVDVPARAAGAWHAMLAKFLPPRLAKHRDVSADLGCWGLYGPASAAGIAAATGVAEETLRALPPGGALPFAGGGPFQVLVRSVDLGGALDGYDVFAAPEVLATVRAASGITAVADEATWHVARVEAGRPEWGLDMDDGTIPQEANFDALRAISYTKGCYTGQETVARVHFRGHVNRLLRRLTSSAPIPAGATVSEGDKTVGDVRSSVVSPRLGAVALAMVRREIPDGASLRWTIEGEAPAAGTAIVGPLPLGD